MSEMTELTIRRPDDFHVHFREGSMLEAVAQLTADRFARAVIMPNLADPVLSADDAAEYLRDIQAALALNGSPDFTPLMTIQITGQTTPAMVHQAFLTGVVAGKVYPRGMTTNSENGVLNYHAPQLLNVFAAMEDCGMLLLLHGEHPESGFCLDRERDFIDRVLLNLPAVFPQLRVVLEHVTTALGVRVVNQLPNMAATVTAHHLFLTLDDVVGDKLCPHHFCKPLAKSRQDRDALLEAAMSGSPKFFLGTDSAPHDRTRKECDEGCAGVFTAPIAVQLLAELFEQHGHLDRLEPFVSEFGARFYGLPLNAGTLTLRRDPTVIPLRYFHSAGDIIPFRAGQEIAWRCLD